MPGTGGKKGRKIGTHMSKCKLYKDRGIREKNKKRKAEKMERHLLMAKLRREKNHPVEA